MTKLASVLIAFNLGLQVLDWISSLMGFREGGIEVNPISLWFIDILGNEYLGISVAKLASICFLIFVLYFVNKKVTKTKTLRTRNTGLFLVNMILVYGAIEIGGAVWHNLIALGL